jgi:hypothetical protein
VANPTEQHNTVTLKQHSEANQLIQRNKFSPVEFPGRVHAVPLFKIPTSREAVVAR